MKLVYSLYISTQSNGSSTFCGYKSSSDLLDSLLLSSTVSSPHFSACMLYCNRSAAELIEQDGRSFPFTEIVVCLDPLDKWLNTYNWAYAKIVTYSLQKGPFLHLDIDAILSDGLPSALLQRKFLFQQKETITDTTHTFYRTAFVEAQRLGFLPTHLTQPEFAMNMGLFGCPTEEALPILKAYCNLVQEYVEKQQASFEKVVCKGEQSVMFEQLFMVAVLQANKLQEGVDFDTLVDDKGKNKFYPTNRYAHFFADWKRNNRVIAAIRKELLQLGLHKKAISPREIQH
jgi:hypothetical protein